MESTESCGRDASAVDHTGAALPKLTGPVVDGANILSASAEAEFASQLQELERQTRDQLVVVTSPDLRGEPIEQLGLRLGNGWGVGRDDLDNGVLLIVAPNDRKVRIEVGCGLEGLLTDAKAQTIIEESLLPSLRAGAYERAAEAGVREIVAVLLSDVGRPRYKAK